MVIQHSSSSSSNVLYVSPSRLLVGCVSRGSIKGGLTVLHGWGSSLRQTSPSQSTSTITTTTTTGGCALSNVNWWPFHMPLRLHFQTGWPLASRVVYCCHSKSKQPRTRLGSHPPTIYIISTVVVSAL
uniref:Uncharacterized protein n=1 Tax=Nelumbo nucifera TaxID=4432 RepID=A0A822Y0K3_NELNU|nr:TPA_asm: hypothetical protein HUJ06_026240 [Nelumbo nucifera]